MTCTELKNKTKLLFLLSSQLGLVYDMSHPVRNKWKRVFSLHDLRVVKWKQYGKDTLASCFIVQSF